uniref:Uncharacterized protein n=1 Tax=Megaviridae environmental sample TaxID=1737588 RepID=A0A5J6VI73_9VIRU|nr:MAG: hypothetical protein [Megaviridae environmental sample]
MTTPVYLETHMGMLLLDNIVATKEGIGTWPPRFKVKYMNQGEQVHYPAFCELVVECDSEHTECFVHMGRYYRRLFPISAVNMTTDLSKPGRRDRLDGHKFVLQYCKDKNVSITVTPELCEYLNSWLIGPYIGMFSDTNDFYIPSNVIEAAAISRTALQLAVDEELRM